MSLRKQKISRKTAIQKMGLLLAKSAAVCSPLSAKTIQDFTKNNPVVIIGAGLAGLTAAYELRKAGILSTVYEAAEEPGGRIRVNRNYFADNVPAELGAEFVSKSDKELRRLIDELRLGTTAYEENNKKEMIFYSNKRSYDYRWLCKDYRNIWEKIRKDLKTRRTIANHLDNILYQDYLTKLEASKRLQGVLDTILSCETGMVAQELSAANFLNLYAKNKNSDCFLPSRSMMHNHMRIDGNTDALTKALTQKVIDHVFFKKRLTQIDIGSDQITLTLNRTQKIQAKYVILTLPFTALRKVKIRKKQWKRSKLEAIRSLKYGIGGKIIFQFDNGKSFRGKPLRLIAENLGYGWRSSKIENSEKYLYTVWFVNRGWEGQIRNSEQAFALRKKILKRLNGFYFLLENRALNKQLISLWSEEENIWGSHPILKHNQDRKIYQFIQEPQGRILFAGDHCDKQDFGRMNGAVKSAARVAAQIQVKLKEI